MIRDEKMYDKMSIYVCSDLLSFFVKIILPKICNTFTLVSGDSDMQVPKEALTNEDTKCLINNKYLIQWFPQNTQIQDHPKIIQLPIGLDYHTISTNFNHCWKTDGENSDPQSQENLLINIKNNSLPFFERIPKIYVNFSASNNRFGQRKDAFSKIHAELLIINQTFTKRTENWNNTVKYTFVLSPFGMGMDCHRTWEALCLGSIPIICAPNFTKLFEDLPVLIVTDFSQISPKLLQDTISDFKNRTFNYDKLTLKYWTNKINSI
jgi:hypothetical protein